MKEYNPRLQTVSIPSPHGLPQVTGSPGSCPGKATKYQGTATVLGPYLEQEAGEPAGQEPQPCVNNGAPTPSCPLLYKGSGTCRFPSHTPFSTEHHYMSCFPDAGRQSLEDFQRPRANPQRPRKDKGGSPEEAASGADHQVTGPHCPRCPCLNPPGLGLDCEGVAPMLLL